MPKHRRADNRLPAFLLVVASACVLLFSQTVRRPLATFFDERDARACKIHNHREWFQRIDPDVTCQIRIGEGPGRSR